MNATAKPWKTLCAVVLASSLVGCASVREPVPVRVQRDATLPLIRHPQFTEAVKAAPVWVSDVLLQITRYEAELARRDR